MTVPISPSAAPPRLERSSAASRAATSRSNTAGQRNQIDRLPALAADLVRLKVGRHPRGRGGKAVLAAMAATHDDSDRVPDSRRPGSTPGFVASLNRPGGNVTGLSNWFGSRSRRQGARGCCASCARSPPSASLSMTATRPFRNLAHAKRRPGGGAHTRRRELRVLEARDPSEIDAAFANRCKGRVGGASMSVADPFIISSRRPNRYVRARGGDASLRCTSTANLSRMAGLMSYGNDITRTCIGGPAIYIGQDSERGEARRPAG